MGGRHSKINQNMGLFFHIGIEPYIYTNDGIRILMEHLTNDLFDRLKSYYETKMYRLKLQKVFSIDKSNLQIKINNIYMNREEKLIIEGMIFSNIDGIELEEDNVQKEFTQILLNNLDSFKIENFDGHYDVKVHKNQIYEMETSVQEKKEIDEEEKMEVIKPRRKNEKKEKKKIVSLRIIKPKKEIKVKK